MFDWCNLVEQGSHSGESARLPPMWRGFDMGQVRCVVEFVVGSRSCSEGFSGLSGFPSEEPTFQIPIRPG